MAGTRRLIRRAAPAAALLGAIALLGGCASPSKPTSQPAAAPPAIPAVSYDWHPLLIAPLGTWFRDMPVPLSEVLQFHEAGESGRAEECFKPKDTSPPAFLGRAPDDYLLCFTKDRLSRVEAAVHLSSDQAAALFAAACADWQKNGQPGASSADSCSGRADDVEFSGKLVDAVEARADPGTSEAPPPAVSAPTVSVSLVRVAP
jgi:hypothetical protein